MPDRPNLDHPDRAASQLAAIVDSSEDAIISKDLDGCIITWNAAAERIYGYPAAEAIGRPMTMLLPPDRPDEEADILNHIRRGMRFQHFETVRQRKNGQLIQVSLTISPVRDETGRIVGASHIARDISERKLAQEEIRAAKEQLQLVTDNMAAAVTRCSRDFRYVWVSRGYAKWMGSPAHRIMGKAIHEVVGEQGFQDIRPYIEQVLSGERVEYTSEVHFLGPGDRWIHAIYSPTYSQDHEVDGWIAVVTDITDQRRLELANAHLAAIVASTEDAIISKDLDGTILTWNAAAERIYGYRAEEAIGQKMLLMCPPEHVQEEMEILAKIRRGESISHFETKRLKKGGAGIEVSLTISPIRDQGGKIVGASHIARDITERKHAEKLLQQTQRLESLGVLAGGIAHDFNNLLVGILGNISLAQESLSTNHPARIALQNALGASERASGLTRQLLAYAGKGRFVIEPVNLSELIREIGELIQTSIPKNVQLRLDLARDLPLIEADTSQLQQLIMNLVINGAEAIGEDRSGAVLVATGVQDVDEAYLRSTLIEEIQPGRYVSLEVHDTGAGMDAATISRIFDPFFTTKFTGRGLGLAAAQGIVRGHKGTLKVYSQPGSGSTFKVLLPITEKQPGVQPPRAATEALAGDATVLVIDDEQIIRQTAKAMLERYGYTVLVAENGKEGVDLFRVVLDKISVVILDMTMPVMSGEETLRHLKLIKPEVKVLLSSGYNESEAIRRFTGKGLVGFIQKPYSAQHLAQTVRAALDAPQPAE